MQESTEVWQRGPINGVQPLLQPVAHALLQAREEIAELEPELNDQDLWKRPAGVASPAFHLQHLSGVLDRVFTYARNESLNPLQFEQLANEDLPFQESVTVASLVTRFYQQVDEALSQLKDTEQGLLTEFRAVGRKKLPSTTIGLLFHAAEHTMRHLGQLRVTIKFLAKN